MTRISNESMANENPLQLMVHRIYVKSSNFESALAPTEMIAPEKTNIDFEARSNAYERGNDQHEAVLTLNFTAKHDGNLLWRVQLQQAGLYTLKDFNEEQRKQVLNGFCMNQLYPYACAAITQLVVQGGFPALTLMPIDFDRVYQEQLKNQAPMQSNLPS